MLETCRVSSIRSSLGSVAIVVVTMGVVGVRVDASLMGRGQSSHVHNWKVTVALLNGTNFKLKQ